MLIEVGVITLPSHAEQLEGKPEKLALPLQQVVAETDQAAVLLVGVQNAAKLKDVELSRAKVVIRRVG
jgi:hypothetical protein